MTTATPQRGNNKADEQLQNLRLELSPMHARPIPTTATPHERRVERCTCTADSLVCADLRHREPMPLHTE